MELALVTKVENRRLMPLTLQKERCIDRMVSRVMKYPRKLLQVVWIKPDHLRSTVSYLSMDGMHEFKLKLALRTKVNSQKDQLSL